MVNISISPDRNKLAIIPRGYDPEVIRMMENVPGKRWMRQFNCWFAPFSNETLIYIKSLLSQVTEISVDQKVQDFLNDQDTRANSIIDLKTQPVTDATLPADLTFTTKPFDHQKIAISLGLKNRNFAFFMEMGTGKTKVILDIIGYYLPKIKELRRPALVVCPVSVLWNWEVQIKKHRPELKVQVLSGSLNGKIMGLISDADVFIVNYESAWRMYESLAKIKWGFVILDESTRIKNRAAKQAKAMIKLGSVASRRYILTGTPAPNSPLELYNQIRFLESNVF
jgi:SNF2 family DNA or RNA helicase